MPATDGGKDAVKKQHNLGAFAQYRDTDHDGYRGRWPVAGRHRTSDGAHLAGKLAPVARHPGIVPGQHADGDQQDCGIEQLLAGAVEQRPQFAGKSGDHARAQHAGEHTGSDPPAAARHGPGCRQHDAHDQAGLDDLTEDNDKAREHRRSLMRRIRNCS
jgi:hypothetical protein